MTKETFEEALQLTHSLSHCDNIIHLLEDNMCITVGHGTRLDEEGLEIHDRIKALIIKELEAIKVEKEKLLDEL